MSNSGSLTQELIALQSVDNGWNAVFATKVIMHNLQKAIDEAGTAEAERHPVSQPEAVAERERAFDEQVHRLKALREERASQPEVERLPLLFEVVRHRGHWRTLHRKKYSGPLENQAAAIEAAKAIARKKRELGHPVEVRLVRTDGQVIVQSLDDQTNG